MSAHDSDVLQVDATPPPPTRRRWLPAVLVALALAVAVVATLLLGPGGGDDAGGAADPAATAGPDEGDAAAEQPAGAERDPALGVGPFSGRPTEPPGDGETIGTPVAYVAATTDGYRLYREFRDVPDVGGRVASAVSAMTSMEPVDPDYFTPWTPASRVEATTGPTEIHVDLSADAFGAQIDEELAERAVQQLVSTALAAAVADDPARPVVPVRVTVDGGPYTAWGVVPLGEPLEESRSPADVLGPVWLTFPGQGAVVPAGPLRVSGLASAPDGVLRWQVRHSDGTVVDEGPSIAGGPADALNAFGFTSRPLEPGDYTVTVWQPEDTSPGSSGGTRLFADSKAITVR